MTELIRLEGMREARQALKQLDKRFPKAVQKANKKAAEIVAEKTRAHLALGPGKAPATAQTVKALAGQAYASVRLGGNPTAMGDNFGSLRFKQFRGWKQGGEADYGLYRAIGDTREEVIDRYADLVDDEIKAAFPD